KIPNIIYTAHGYYFHEGMNKKTYTFYYTLEKYFAKYTTDYLLLQSSEDYNLSIQKKFKNIGRIIHLGNGVDIYNKFNPMLYNKSKQLHLIREFNLSSNDFVITFIGRLVKEKGFNDLINSFNILKQMNLNVKLIIVG